MLLMLLLRFEPDDRLFDTSVRFGRFGKLSKCSSSLDSQTSHTEEVVLFRFSRPGSDAAGSVAPSNGEDTPGSSASDQTDDTRDR